MPTANAPPDPPDPRPALRFRPSVTVAAVIARAGAEGRTEYLLVEEHTADGLRLNNPAGHLEQGESPEQAVVREVLEETTCTFQPLGFLGVMLARFQRGKATGVGDVKEGGTEGVTADVTEDVTYVRLAYAGTVGLPDAGRKLDDGIVRTLWLSWPEILSRRHELRSPLVLHSLEVHRAGRWLPLSSVHADTTVWSPEQR
jgi:8-oxo-dGTP pyrophosphatase MutT (NUDIX family)